MTYNQKNQLLDYFPFTKNELNKIQNAGFIIIITKDYNKRREIKFVLDSFDKITKKLD